MISHLRAGVDFGDLGGQLPAPTVGLANVLLDTVKRARRQLSDANSADNDLTVGHYEFDPASRFGGVEWTAGRLLSRRR